MESTFSLSIGTFVEKTKANADQVLRKVSAEVLREVVLRSPVDTGAFRGAWVAAIGEVVTQPSPVLDKTGELAISRAEAVLRRASVGQVISIVNNLPYGPRLEYGWSQQAPQGMVRLTIARWQEFVAKAALEAR